MQVSTVLYGVDSLVSYAEKQTVRPGCHSRLFRYNAFHIACRCDRPEILQLLIDLLRDPRLFQMLYADNDENTINQRIKYVINMYLNIPDKT